MRCLLDEAVSVANVAPLARRRHEVSQVSRQGRVALADRDVLAAARADQRVLITTDRDFAQSIVRQNLPHAGVILFRVTDESPERLAAWVQYIVEHHPDRLTGLIVVMDQGIRIRHSTPRLPVAGRSRRNGA